MGAHVVQGSAIKTNDIVGDGNTTATVIPRPRREGMEAIGKGRKKVLVNEGNRTGQYGHMVE